MNEKELTPEEELVRLSQEEKRKREKGSSGSGRTNEGITGKDIDWILPLVFLTVATLWLWKLPGLIVLVIGLIGIFAAAFILAGTNTLFMSAPQNAAVAIMYGSGEKSKLERMIVVKGKDVYALDAESNRMPVYWFEKKFNIFWLGIPFLGRVYTYPMETIIEEREEKEVKGEEVITETRRVVIETRDYISLKEEIYHLIIPPILCADRFDVIPDMVVYAKVVDPFKALFEVGNLIKAMRNIVEPVVRNQIGGKKLDEILVEKEVIASKAWEKLEKDGFLKRMPKEWGIEMTKPILMRDITPEPEASQKIKRVSFAEIDAKARAEEGKGERDYRTLVAEGDKQALVKRGEGLESLYSKLEKTREGLGLRQAQIDGLLGAQGVKWISLPDFTKALSGETGMSSKQLIASLTALGLTLEDVQDMFEKLSEKKSKKKREETGTEEE